MSREALLSAVWSLAPAVLGGSLASLASDRTGTALFLLIAHQLAVVAIVNWKRDQRQAWGPLEWSLLAAGAAATVAFTAPQLVLWLMLPIAPAMLLRVAQRERPLPRATTLMRTFSVATVGAILVQLEPALSNTGEIVAVLGATLLFLASVERLTTDGDS